MARVARGVHPPLLVTLHCRASLKFTLVADATEERNTQSLWPCGERNCPAPPTRGGDARFCLPGTETRSARRAAFTLIPTGFDPSPRHDKTFPSKTDGAARYPDRLMGNSIRHALSAWWSLSPTRFF